MSLDARHQCRMELTMFFPTPKITEAFSEEKMFGSFVTASIPFFSHVYRNGKVWCPEKDGVIDCGMMVCVLLKLHPRNIAAADANRDMSKKAGVTTEDMTTKNRASGAIVRNGARTRGIGKYRECFLY